MSRRKSLLPASLLLFSSLSIGSLIAGSYDNIADIRTNDKYATTLFYMAERNFKKEKFDRAIPYLRLGLSHAPRNVKMRYMLANALAKSGSLKLAIKELSECIRIDPFFNDAKRRIKKLKHLDHFINEDFDMTRTYMDLKKPIDKLPQRDLSEYSAQLPKRAEKNLYYVISTAEDMEVLKGGALDAQISEAPDGARIDRLKTSGLIVKDPSGAPAGAHMPVRVEREKSVGEKIQDIIDMGDFKVALKLAESLGAKTPDSPTVFWLKGQIYHRKGDYNNAEKELSHLVKIKPGNVEFLFLLAKTQFKAGKLTQARKNYNSILTLDPNNLYASLDLAQIANLTGQSSKATVIYKKLLKDDPDLIDVSLSLAEIELHKGQVNKAEKRALKILDDQDSENARAINILGEIYLRKGNIDQALLQFDKAISLLPRYAGAHYNKGLAYLEQGSAQNAVASFKKSHDLDKSALANTYRLVQTLVVLGQIKEANTYFTEVLKDSGSHHASFAIEGLIQKGEKNFQHAIQSFKKAIKIFGNKPEYWTELADCYLSLSDFSNAISVSKQAIKKFPHYSKKFEFENIAYTANEKMKQKANEQVGFQPIISTPKSGGSVY